MNKIFALFLIIAVLTNTSAQELNGIWISNDDPIGSGSASQNRAEGGMLLDFDSKNLSTLFSEKTSSIVVNRKQTKIKATGIKGKLKVLKAEGNKLHLIGSKNRLYVFEKLDLSHSLDMTAKDLSRFLIDQQCRPIQGIKGQFTKEQFYLDKKANKPHKRNQFINFGERSNGYWYFKKIKGNAFFVLTTGDTRTENILQVLSVSVNGLSFKPLQEDHILRDFTELKTCL